MRYKKAIFKDFKKGESGDYLSLDSDIVSTKSLIITKNEKKIRASDKLKRNSYDMPESGYTFPQLVYSKKPEKWILLAQNENDDLKVWEAGPDAFYEFLFMDGVNPFTEKNSFSGDLPTVNTSFLKESTIIFKDKFIFGRHTSSAHYIEQSSIDDLTSSSQVDGIPTNYTLQSWCIIGDTLYIWVNNYNEEEDFDTNCRLYKSNDGVNFDLVLEKDGIDWVYTYLESIEGLLYVFASNVYLLVNDTLDRISGYDVSNPISLANKIYFYDDKKGTIKSFDGIDFLDVKKPLFPVTFLNRDEEKIYMIADNFDDGEQYLYVLDEDETFYKRLTFKKENNDLLSVYYRSVVSGPYYTCYFGDYEYPEYSEDPENGIKFIGWDEDVVYSEESSLLVTRRINDGRMIPKHLICRSSMLPPYCKIRVWFLEDVITLEESASWRGDSNGENTSDLTDNPPAIEMEEGDYVKEYTFKEEDFFYGPELNYIAFVVELLTTDESLTPELWELELLYKSLNIENAK